MGRKASGPSLKGPVLDESLHRKIEAKLRYTSLTFKEIAKSFQCSQILVSKVNKECGLIRAGRGYTAPIKPDKTKEKRVWKKIFAPTEIKGSFLS